MGKEYYYEDAIEYIRSVTGLDYDTVDEVLMAELDYMRSIGLVVDFESEDE